MCTDGASMNYRLTSDFVVVLLEICLTGCLFFMGGYLKEVTKMLDVKFSEGTFKLETFGKFPYFKLKIRINIVYFSL